MHTGDLLVIGVVLVSGIIAFMRGFIREVLSLAGWVGAILVTLWGFTYARTYARTLIDNPLLADIAAGATLFVVSLVMFALVSNAFGNLVRNSGLNALDRSLGLVFGAARGLVIVALAYLALASWVWTSPAGRPDWITQARTLPLVEATAEKLRALAPPEFRGQAAAAARQVEEVQPYFRVLTAPTAKPSPEGSETGYKAGDRRDLERLIETTRPNTGQAR